MLYTFLKKYVNKHISALNGTLTVDLVENTIELGKDFLPVTLQDMTYLIKLNSTPFVSDSISNSEFEVSGYIEFYFNLFNSSTERYKEIIDSYLYPLLQRLASELYYDTDITGNTKLQVTDFLYLGIDDLDELDSDGEVLIPKITFNLKLLQR